MCENAKRCLVSGVVAAFEPGVSRLLSKRGYEPIYLGPVKDADIARGYVSIDNDVCVSAVAVVGQYVQALELGRTAAAVLVPELCHDCRTVSLHRLLLLALRRNGFSDVALEVFTDADFHMACAEALPYSLQRDEQQRNDLQGSNRQGNEQQKNDPQGSARQGSARQGSEQQGSRQQGSNRQGNEQQGSGQHKRELQGSDQQGSERIVGVFGPVPVLSTELFSRVVYERLTSAGYDVCFPPMEHVVGQQDAFKPALEYFQTKGITRVIGIVPFGCMSGHVYARGHMRRWRDDYPSIDIVLVDYDPSASDINVVNRIELALQG